MAVGTHGRGSPLLDGLGDRAGLWPAFNDLHPFVRSCIPKMLQSPETVGPAGDQVVQHGSTKGTFLLQPITVTTGVLAHTE